MRPCDQSVGLGSCDKRFPRRPNRPRWMPRSRLAPTRYISCHIACTMRLLQLVHARHLLVLAFFLRLHRPERRFVGDMQIMRVYESRSTTPSASDRRTAQWQNIRVVRTSFCAVNLAIFSDKCRVKLRNLRPKKTPASKSRQLLFLAEQLEHTPKARPVPSRYGMKTRNSALHFCR